ncbi:MAG: sodium:calcium antiporter, partial [Planctomycetota bacterium]
RLDIPVMIAAAAALWVLGANGSLSRIEAVGLVLALIAYFIWTVTKGRSEQKQLEAELEGLSPAGGAGAITLAVAQFVAGLVLLVGGANYLVQGCTELAVAFGVSELVIGLTVTAIGTSLPELVTSLMAALRGKRDLAVGNVVGSNILNILAVLGISGAVSPTGIPVSGDALGFHIPLMVAVSVVCFPVFFTGLAIVRAEGVAMLLFYAAYLGYAAYAARTHTPGAAVTLAFVAGLAVIGGVSVAFGRRAA